MSLAAVGDGAADIPSRQEVEQLLDDPNPRGEIQRGFALRYLDYVEEDPTAYGFRDEADFHAFKEKYKERLSISDGDLFRSLAGAEDDVQYYYTKAKEDHDKIRADARQGDRDAVNGGASALEAIRGRSSEANPGAANSNEILDAGLSGLRAFDVWLPLYNRSLAIIGGGAAVPLEEIYRLYDEQRDIPFDKFDAGAGELATLRDAIDGSSAEVEGKLQSAFSTWEGAAADQAREYQRGFTEKTSVVADAIGTSAEGLRHTLGSVGKFCQEKADWVLTYYFDSFGDITAQDMERLVRVAEGHGSQNDIIHCIGFLGIEAKNRFNDDWGGLDQETVDFIVEQAGVWLRDVFCTWFGEHLNNYRMMCENIRVAVDGAWSAFPEMLARIPENPYAELGTIVAAKQSPPAGPPAPGGPVAGQTVGAGGGAVSPPGTGGAGSDVPAPAVPAPAVPTAVTEPAANVPTSDTVPQATPSVVPEPESKDLPSEPGVLTISHGDYEISLSMPTDDGTMEITLDDGSGAPQDYVLDFAAQSPDLAAEPEGREAFGPAGTPHEDDRHRPNADGRIQVEDGGLRVVAEQPDGPDGDTVVTVDDGRGEPTTYTLGAEARPQTVEHAGAGDPAEPAPTGAARAAEQVTSPQSVSGQSGVAAGAAVGDISRGAMAGDPEPGVPVSGADVGGSPRQPAPGAGLGSAPGGAAPAGGDQSTSASTGMGMMGGAGGAAGGSGGDQERGAGAYRVAGDIFDTGGFGDRISGTLGVEEDHDRSADER
ncbi:hypothetical protein SAMN05216266_10880 [Amycolatopsis marina]|uniref:Proteins of 100 residues with WXG n=1 Tax=Amycolatopsis marina TaxID=490629 RepID=A0A1I1A505_9PSEU|nr:hypothetical protein [Amycolatopsis marina]SFB31570.1 hypothetical protein SAMN05216266_10880 [Amycolatopsis marina]